MECWHRISESIGQLDLLIRLVLDGLHVVLVDDGGSDALALRALLGRSVLHVLVLVVVDGGLGRPLCTPGGSALLLGRTSVGRSSALLSLQLL